MPIKHFLQFKDFSRDELDYLFARTLWIKTELQKMLDGHDQAAWARNSFTSTATPATSALASC